MKRIEINELPEQGISHNARIRKRTMLADGELDYARAVAEDFRQAIGL